MTEKFYDICPDIFLVFTKLNLFQKILMDFDTAMEFLDMFSKTNCRLVLMHSFSVGSVSPEPICVDSFPRTV